jgi:hypothetical protein
MRLQRVVVQAVGELERLLPGRQALVSVDPGQRAGQVHERTDLLGGAAVLARVAGQGREGLDGGGHVTHRAACEADLLEEHELRGDARGLGKPGGDVPRPNEIADRLAIGMPSHGRLRGLLEVADRARVVAGGLEVRGELRGDVARAIGVSGLLALADGLVHLAPPPGGNPLVQRAPVQRVNERVAGRPRPVRPLARAEGAQEDLAPHELVTALLHVRHRPVHRRRHRGRRELHARHAARLEHVLLVLADALDLPIDHLAKALGHVQVDRFERGAKLPSALARRDEAAREQIIDQGHHEQRIALGARVDDVRELTGERAAREPLAEVVGDCGHAEQRE